MDKQVEKGAQSMNHWNPQNLLQVSKLLLQVLFRLFCVPKTIFEAILSVLDRFSSGNAQKTNDLAWNWIILLVFSTIVLEGYLMKSIQTKARIHQKTPEKLISGVYCWKK